MKLKKRYWLLILLVVLGIGGYFYSQQQTPEDKKKSEDKFTHVAIKTIENKQLISGRLSSSKEVNIKSELAGIIENFYVKVGDNVHKGQAIAKIRIMPDPKSTQDAHRQIEIATINLERIKANYLRNKSLYEKDVISKQEFEVSNQEYKTASVDLESAQNYLKIVKQGFSNKSDFVSNVIYSTIDGIVLDIPIKVGTSIQNRNTFSEGTTIATIADVNEFIFKGQVNEKDLRYIEPNKELSIHINALKNDNFKAYVTRISPKGVDVSGITRFDIEAKLDINPTDLYKIKSGFTATAEFLVDKADNAMALEEKYIQYNEDTSYVYILKGDDEKDKKVVQTGISDGKFIVIKSGLKKEDKIYKEEMSKDNDE